MSEVRRFYDANTWQFLLFGSGQAIHRELYAPGVSGTHEALDYAHRLVDEQLDALGVRETGRVLDLGCGVGAAMRFLAGRSGATFLGVTISPRQVAIARRLASRTRSGERLRFVEADFCALPAEITEFDLAYSIEAFVHSPSAAQYFAGAAGALRPGGRLVIVDDFLAGDPNDQAVIIARDNWHYDSLLTVPNVTELARAAGLVLNDDRDLSAYQNLGRPRDRLIHRSLPLLRRAAPYNRWCQMLVGGDSLQDSLRRGLLQYRELVFVRA